MNTFLNSHSSLFAKHSKPLSRSATIAITRTSSMKTYRPVAKTTKAPPPPARIPSVVQTIGSFTLETENFHGRMAMCGITAAAAVEQLTGASIGQQITSLTGQSPANVGAFVAVVTAGFVLQCLNPNTPRMFEPEPMVWDNPGFTRETEVLHGRIAMLGFAFALIAELTLHNVSST